MVWMKQENINKEKQEKYVYPSSDYFYLLMFYCIERLRRALCSLVVTLSD